MTAQPYNVVAELDVPFDEETVEQLIDPIVDYGGAVGRSELGRTEVVFTLPADSVRQANTTALAILEQYPSTLLSLRVMTAADFDRLTEAAELPPLVSVSEAAEELGVSRQSILKSIKSAKLPATRVGDTWAVRKSVVQARARESAKTA
ncbi:helix-turn-helix domain-containing protein [Rhodococcus sp. (in: high G+C Gram-positive bacteria)]|uniref:helix-turn-helix domain-containing protein n=1 Tax=Rhodococcus sp. TaxID=1831 RepID=UPI00257A3C4A|nr:helix-turn-helix domain-containing protein [Rhodococcus sp. (in: high G+C Gram-positive bacteria)]MBQ7804389.1 helix-turn-helix domain-containing protein [Rhodococcus sp. (in: high G+C Gram-positive bacteria)]